MRQFFISPSMTSVAGRSLSLIVPPEIRRLVTQARRLFSEASVVQKRARSHPQLETLHCAKSLVSSCADSKTSTPPASNLEQKPCSDRPEAEPTLTIRQEYSDGRTRAIFARHSQVR